MLHALSHNLCVCLFAVGMKPTEVHLRRYICNEVGTGWEELCIFLGIPYTKIVHTNQYNLGRTREAFFQCLLHWADGNTDKEPTWLALLEALELAELKGVATSLKKRILNDRL